MRYEHEQIETFQGIATDKMTRSLYKVCTGGGDDDAMLAALYDSFGESHESGGSRNWPHGYLVQGRGWTVDSSASTF